ncbi:hypothetical protein OIU78_027498 [Salix suchowensis]|nr:hypothetical protein OIU78_027498 [Salix suchowensis]
MQTRTVEVKNVSDLASEREVHEFFSFSGEIENIRIQRDNGQSKTAIVTFKDPKALEIALLLSGATIVDQIVSITPVENYVPNHDPQFMQEVRNMDIAIHAVPSENIPSNFEGKTSPSGSGSVYASRAQEVVTSMLAKGSAIGQDAMNKAKAFDDKHRLSASASEKRYLQLKGKINDTGSAVKSSRYVSAGTAWLNGAFSKVAKAGQVAGTKTRAKFNLAVSNLTAKESPIAV